jgi:Glycosyl hydrolase family 3 C-terminal domain/Glycosyl hydrolase family 3 N terminal domain
MEFGWEHYTPLTERARRTGGFRVLNGNTDYVVNPQPSYKSSWDGWGPRVQVSWAPEKNLSIHAGGAVTVIPFNIWQDNLLTGSTPFADYPRRQSASATPLAYGFAITPDMLPTAYDLRGNDILANGTKKIASNTPMDVDRFEKDLARVTSSGAVSPLNLSGVDANWDNASLYTWTTGVERRFANLTADLAYVGTTATHLPRISYPNAYPGATEDFARYTQFDSNGNVAGGFGVMNVVTDDVHSTYHALQTSLSGTVQHGGPGIQASYTYGKSIDSTSFVQGGAGSTGAVVPASGNHWLLTDVLRKEWGFQGFVLSDAFAVGSLVDTSLNMDMASLTYAKNLAKLVRDGKISEAYIDQMVLPILETKYDLGLFEHPYADESKVDAVLGRPEGLSLERKLAGRSMVQLRNENQTLPLSKGLKKVAVIDPLADSARDVEGGWTVEGLFGGGGKSHPVTVLAGIKNKLAVDARITLVAGPTPARLYPGFMDAFSGRKQAPPPTQEEIADWIAKAKAAATDADVVVAVMGESASMNGEAASRATLDLPGIQEQMLQTVAIAGKPVVLVLEGGRPLDIRWASDTFPRSLKRGIQGRKGEMQWPMCCWAM